MALTKAQAKSLSILEIARILGMEMKRNSHKEYYWKDHDSFKIDTYKNTWHWYSRGTYGDTINLVQEIRQVSYADAMKFLETGQFPEAKPMEEVRQPFRYSLNSYEQPFREARNYLKEVRSLSDETINFFLEKGVLAQARRRDRDGFTEDVLVFKYLDKSQTIVGASLQGLSPYPERYEGKGYLKQIMYQSEGIAGLNVSIGSPKRLIVAEAPIDLMSYYELHKDQLEDVRLVAMEGLKEGIVSRYAMEALQEQGILVEDGRDYTKARDLAKTSQFLAKAAQRSTLFHDHKQDNLITLAVDNDKAGTDFIETLREKKIPIIDARPPKGEGDRKMDWNQYLKENQTERKAMTEDTKKAPEPILEQEKKEGTNVSWGSLQPKAEGSPAPVAETSTTFEQTVTSHPTISPRLLYFTTDNAHVSIIRDGYHIATEEDLRNLNAYAPILQQTAQWYLTTLAGSSVTYVYQEDGKVDAIKINYDKDKFMHLTGIRPIGKNLTAERLVERFAAGDGHFANILVNRGFISKAQVLPLFEEIIQAKSFMFTNIADIKKMKAIHASSAIRTENEQLLLAFKTFGDVSFPVSTLNLTEPINLQLTTKGTKNTILGVYRERNGVIEQLSINDDYIQDGGKELLAILKDGNLEAMKTEILKDETASIHPKIDSDGDGISDEEERKQGTNPYDFRSTPSSKAREETSPNVTESIGMSSSLAVADFIKNKDIAGLNRHLKDGIKEYLNSDKYKDYLTKMSQLNHYSSRNLRLILAQNPEATQVASFKQWKETFERHVKKGEKSLRIFAPMTKLQKDENNQPILDKNGKPETVTFFGLVPVFDVSQTEGKEMPKAISEVKEQVSDLDYANLYRAMMTIAKANNVSVRFEEMQGEAKGYYNPAEHQIVLRSNDMNKSQLIKTFLHETAHSELHHANNPQQEQLTRSTAELQAESVAYVVSAYYGLDTSDYSFGYLASWSDDKETLADLEAQLDIVQQEAKSLMVRMDQQLEQLRLTQEKQTKYQFEQKLQKFKDQSKQAVEDHKQEMKQEAQSKKEKGLSK
ncbi:PBECR4 domain-containing protein [Streptococcus dysgalactiae]|uniref:Conjugative transposon membrane protein n=2 Tax=Streptococcus dysgalactiae TaxID=1334 RepID=A0A9X8T0T9_STREQ|nr:PBECR4 domain-containing protein [Streptococcus dysgalactiae]SQF68013.1 putative conjugative transposon membrane protein [Streptococcus dysgalactiae subsp. equisimilis]VEF04918.1 putative conjugative transposon membrane protein [Streptococcus dysgalactiae subsp. equisimilis]